MIPTGAAFIGPALAGALLTTAGWASPDVGLGELMGAEVGAVDGGGTIGGGVLTVGVAARRSAP